MKKLGAFILFWFSPRFWIPIAVIVGFAMIDQFKGKLGFIDLLLKYDFLLILIVIIIVLLIVTVINIAGVYTISGVSSFVVDIILDVLYIVVLACLLVISHYEEFGIYAMSIFGVCLFFSIIDFVLSLIGGASKLLEMDKGSMAIVKEG